MKRLNYSRTDGRFSVPEGIDLDHFSISGTGVKNYEDSYTNSCFNDEAPYGEIIHTEEVPSVRVLRMNSNSIRKNS